MSLARKLYEEHMAVKRAFTMPPDMIELFAACAPIIKSTMLAHCEHVYVMYGIFDAWRGPEIRVEFRDATEFEHAQEWLEEAFGKMPSELTKAKEYVVIRVIIPDSLDGVQAVHNQKRCR